MKQVERHVKHERIAVPRNSLEYLEKIMREQRGCKPLSDEKIERAWRRRRKNENGMVILEDNSMGGGDGTYYGKWTNWSCEDLRRMLREKGLPWEDLEPIEYDCVDVYI